MAPSNEAQPAPREGSTLGTTVSVVVLFVSSAGMVASAMFGLFMLSFGATRNMLVAAGLFIVAVSVYVVEVRALARPSRSRSTALYWARVASLCRAPLPPVVCGMAVVLLFLSFPFPIPIVLLGFVKWAHSARRRIADDLCAFRHSWDVRRVREVVLLLETLLILGTLPLLWLTIALLGSLGFRFGGFYS